MTVKKVTSRISLPVVIIILLLASTVAFAAGKQDGSTQQVSSAPPTPQMVGVNTPPPPPPLLSPAQAQVQPAALSPVLSYYFIAGNTFTPGGPVSYARQVIGCVNQMPLYSAFTAPVHLPQGAQVVSMTLYTYNSAITTTVSAAYFLLSDGKGLAGSTLSASSQPNIAGYQQNNNTLSNPTTVDNQNYSYYIQWSTSGAADSPILSLCGVRLAYYAPGSATYLPTVIK